MTRTLHYSVTCDDCGRFGSVGFLTDQQTGWPPHEPFEVTACWLGGGLPPELASPLDRPCGMFVKRGKRWRSGQQPTVL